MNAVDLGIIAAFLALVAGLATSAKLRTVTGLEYVAAGRQLTLPLFVATLISTWYGGILGISESVTYYGVGTWLLLGVPYYLFGLIYAFLLARRVRSASQISIPERLTAAFGRSSGIASAFLLFLLAVPAAHVLMLGTLLSFALGWPTIISVCVAGVVAVVLLYRGGLLADVRVGVVGTVLMYLGFALILIHCVQRQPFGEAVQALDPPLRGVTGGQSGLAIFTFFILGAWTLVDPGFHQRVAATATPEVAQRGLVVCVLGWMLFDTLTVATAIYAVSLLPDPPANPLMIFPALGQYVLSSGPFAVFFCALLGLIISAMVGYTLVSGATLGRDVWTTWRPTTDGSEVVRRTRIGMVVGIVIAVGLALGIQSVVALWYAWAGAVAGALVLPILLAYLPTKFRIPDSAITVSMLVSFGVSFTWLVVGQRTNNPFLNVSFLGQTFSLGTLIPGLFVSGMILAGSRLIGNPTEAPGKHP